MKKEAREKEGKKSNEKKMWGLTMLTKKCNLLPMVFNGASFFTENGVHFLFMGIAWIDITRLETADMMGCNTHGRGIDMTDALSYI